jgi:hypothetical protein
MKLSSRKKLLDESDIVLTNIRKKIEEQTICEEYGDDIFFNQIIKSIISSISVWFKNKRQGYFYKKIPYLIGIDLINKNNLKINDIYIKNLESLIESIIKDVISSNKLKTAIRLLTKIDSEIVELEDYLKKIKLRIKDPKYFQPYNLKIEDKKSVELEINSLKANYNRILTNTVSDILMDIFKTEKYKNFEEFINDNLTKGISGISKEDFKKIKNNYISTLKKRVADYVNNHEITHRIPQDQWPQLYPDIFNS